MTLANSKRGAEAKAFGNLFEDIFEKMCRLPAVALTRIPDSCRQLGNKVIRVKSPYDWVLSYRGKTAVLDTKTAQGDAFVCSSISEHQVTELLRHERSGALGGYIVWLRKPNQVFFLPASALSELMKKRGSFSEIHPQARLLGTGEGFDVRILFHP